MKATRALGLVLMLLAGAPAHAEKVLRVAPITDVQLLDPVFGTAWVNVVAGAMIYESLFAPDSKLQPKPQMAESWSVSDDGLTWQFTLRDGLRFHDGQAVTTADVIASMQRWMTLTNNPLKELTKALTPVDDKTFTWALARPFPMMLDLLGAVPSRFPAVMRAQDITDPSKPVTNGIGSGPFRWNAALRVGGSRAVFDRNPGYVPRREPADGLAGGRVVKVDRVEWDVIPDPATVAAALQRGEVDLWERPSVDLVQLLAKNPNVKLQKLTPIATQTMFRPNTLYPPFNDKRARQALNWVFDQADQMTAGYGDESMWQRCNSFFICGGPYGTEAGAEAFKQDFGKARALLTEAGYNGEKLTFISTHDIPWIGQQAEVAADALKRAGVNVDMVWSDWASTAARMSNQDTPEHGGWNLFLVTMTGPVMVNPLINPAVDMSCGRKNLWGWPCDEAVEQLRQDFIYAREADRPAALDRLSRALADASPYRVLCQAEQLLAFRKEVTGVLSSPVIAFWNIEK
ncbi:MAG: ABC transporter substrate-binding protein [Acetobacteraceae bacterium]|nr:ABC transporter substrate-binding protein [Acetobacteraceae bacterium]